MKKKNYILRAGLLMFLFIAAWFLLMSLFNLEEETELRFLNILILAFFSNQLIRKYIEDDGEISYIKGLYSVFLANLIAISLSVIALVIYVKFLDTTFLENFEKGLLFAGEINLLNVSIGIFMEGNASSVIVAFSLMQYWKDVKRKSSGSIPVKIKKHNSPKS